MPNMKKHLLLKGNVLIAGQTGYDKDSIVKDLSEHTDLKFGRDYDDVVPLANFMLQDAKVGHSYKILSKDKQRIHRIIEASCITNARVFAMQAFDIPAEDIGGIEYNFMRATAAQTWRVKVEGDYNLCEVYADTIDLAEEAVVESLHVPPLKVSSIWPAEHDDPIPTDKTFKFLCPIVDNINSEVPLNARLLMNNQMWLLKKFPQFLAKFNIQAFSKHTYKTMQSLKPRLYKPQGFEYVDTKKFRAPCMLFLRALGLQDTWYDYTNKASAIKKLHDKIVLPDIKLI